MTTVGSPQIARSPEETQFVIDNVRKRFVVTQEFLSEGAESLQFFLDSAQTDTKANFLSLSEELKKTGDMAILRNTDHGLMLTVVKKQTRKKGRIKLPVALFVATIVTVFIYGFLSSYNYTLQRQTLSGDLSVATIFTVCLMAIIGIHELGHKIASWHHKMDSSWPYFIPFPGIAAAPSLPGIAIPETLPTLGAFISARDPPPNRDALFDLGISGPIAGLITTVAVAVYAATTAKISAAPPSSGSSGDFLTTWLTSIFVHGSQGVLVGPLFYTLYFAYSLGFLLTFANLLPAWQLDGGHVANAAVSPRVHRYLTWASAGILVLSGLWLMALLIILMAGRVPGLRPLDDVSPLSKKRRIMFWATWVLVAAIFILVIYNNEYFWLLGNSL
jgi:membrane-associated protease RseP (regulator of RpoE activity)